MATTPHVGVRTFLNDVDATPFIIADMSTIGGAFTPGTGIDRTKFPIDTAVHFRTNDAEMTAAAGTGTLRDTIEACNLTGIVASIVAVVPDIIEAPVAARGSILFSAQPANNSTLTLNGVVWTFVSGAPSGNQSQIGGNLAATMTNLVTALNASSVAEIDAATYNQSGGNRLIIQAAVAGVGGNDYTLAASSSPASNATVSAATLTGGLAADAWPQKLTKLVGDSVAKTGAWALDLAPQIGVMPDLLIGPDFTHQRPGNPAAANPLVAAYDALCEKYITPMVIASTPSTDQTAAVQWAADWVDSKNVIAVAQGARVMEGVTVVTRDAAPFVAALMVKTDKEKGGPYYNPGNRPLAILGPSRAVGFSISDPDSEANFLIQNGVNSIVQIERNRTARSVGSPIGKTFWGFWTTCDDPIWRSINVIRTRKAIREVIPRTLVRYMGKNVGAHLAVVIRQALLDFLADLAALPEPAILPGFEVRWDRDSNSNAVLRVGGLVFNANWEESPALTDLQIYTGRREASFDILAAEIQAAMAANNVTGLLG